MRIGLVCPYNIFKGGGVQECVLALQIGLQRRGHIVHIITPTPRAYKGVAPSGITLVGTSTDVKSPFHTTAQVSVSVKTDVLEKILRGQKFDVLHFHEPWVPILSRQILVRSQAKNVATFHAKLPDTIMSRTIERVITPYTRSVLNYLDSLTAVSPAAAEYVQSLTNQDITIVPNGIDLATYKPGSIDNGQSNTILYIGRLEKRKGVKYLLHAYELLTKKYPDLKLLIAGNGPDREKLESYAVSRNLTNVSFLGYVDDKQKLKLLQEATVFCSPALYGESFGIVLLEAMACSTPVVAGNNPGYAGVLTGAGSMGIVDPKRQHSFADTLEALLYDRQKRRRWKKWATGEVQQFSYDHVVERYEALYKKLMS